jgi:hypothetical protein
LAIGKRPLVLPGGNLLFAQAMAIPLPSCRPYLASWVGMNNQRPWQTGRRVQPAFPDEESFA